MECRTVQMRLDDPWTWYETLDPILFGYDPDQR